MKLCSKCKSVFSLDSFYFRKTGKRAGEYYEKCKFCMKERGRKYYHANQKRQLFLSLKRRHKYRLKIKRYIAEIKNQPCQDCGNIYPSFVMDFDHRDPNKKTCDVATIATGGWSIENLEKEIKKCDIVCANCHRIRTFKNKYAEIAKVVTAGL